METRDADRLAKLTKEVLGLGVILALAPVKLLLRRLLPGVTPIDRERWTPVDEGAPTVGDVSTSTAAGVNGAPTAPWPGYEDMNVAQVRDRLTGADPTLRAMVRVYEETHKNRKGVLRATE